MDTLVLLDAIEECANKRGAWHKGVLQYAIDIVEEVENELEEYDEFNERLLEKALLNGASNWHEYSYGGCALIYDKQIAERLCSPSELKKTDYGRKDPNSRDTWLDVQARALYQADALIIKAAKHADLI